MRDREHLEGDSPRLGGYDEHEGQPQGDSTFAGWGHWRMAVLLGRAVSLGEMTRS